MSVMGIVSQTFRKSPLLLLVLSVSLNVALAAKIRSDREVARLAKVQGRLEVGKRVSALDLRQSSGQPVKISYSDSSLPTVLYVMRPGCGWCQRNNENLRSLIASAAGRYRVFVLSTEDKGVDDYAAKYGITTPILQGLSDAAKKEYILGATPQTIVIGQDSVVRQDWIGAYNDIILREIRESLGVQLPGKFMPVDPPKSEGH